jgi:hypothetical protein
MATKFDKAKRGHSEARRALDDPVLAARVCLEDADTRVVLRSTMTPKQVTHAHNRECPFRAFIDRGYTEAYAQQAMSPSDAFIL